MTTGASPNERAYRAPHRRFLVLFGLTLASYGCASTATLAPAFEALSQRRIIVDFTTGVVTPAEIVVQDLASVSHVYVGEFHTSALHHDVQLEVATRLHGVRPIVIGVEWLPAAADSVLALWSAGSLGEDELLERLEWKKVWGHDFSNYREIFGWARSQGVRIVGLNPPRGLAEAVGRHGVAGVPLSLRPALPPLDSGNDPHRLHFRDQLLQHGRAHGHGFDATKLERYYQAQLVRDETMARHVRALQDAEPERLVLVFAGLGHIDRGHGVPLRASRSLEAEPRDFRIVMPIENGDMETLAGDFGATSYPARRADWAWEARPTGTVVARARQTSLGHRADLR